MRATRFLAGAGVLALVLIAGCSDDGDIAEPGIPPQNADLVAEGAVLYEASCAECHGSDLRGTDQGPSHLSEIYEPNHHADIAFLLAVQRGSRAHH